SNLFADSAVLDLTREEIERVAAAAALEWNTVDASIFGTLFTRGIDPQQRSQLGAQYTGRADIETIVEPVVMTPLRREWAEVRAKADALLATEMKVGQASRLSTIEEETGKMPVLPCKPVSAAAAKKNRAAAEKLLTAFLERLKRIRVLDPAGGSGNFLYVTLQKLLDLEKEVNDYLAAHGFTPLFPHVNPGQLYLIEINTYAHSLAQVTVQIGYIQWLRAHGYGFPAEPILMRLDKNFLLADSLFTDWPEVDFIVSNPPFLGNKQMRSELGAEYAGKIWQLFGDRIPAMSDLCCYWFEKARQHIADGKCKAAGLLATTGIKQVGSRHVLERIKESGTVFFAVSDREWTLEGASVRVSLIGFAGKNWGQKPSLDSKEVSQINADLTSGIDLTSKRALASNLSRCFMGTTKVGDFDIEEATALTMLQAANPHGKPNSDVLRPFRNGSDLVRAPSHRWIIDFGVKTPMEEAALYEVPFEYLRTHVKPQREHNGRASYRERWWIHGEARPGFRHAVTALGRYIGTPRVALHRVFVWLDTAVLPDSKVIAIAYDDDFHFGVLQSHIHELWTLATCGWHGVGNDVTYNPTTCFETFPFPDESRTGVPPVPSSTNGQAGRPTHLALEHVAAIAAAAKELNELRERWLNPPEWTREEVLEFPGSSDGPWARYVVKSSAVSGQPSTSPVSGPSSSVALVRYPRLVPKDADCAKLLAKRTLTNLYNERPTWLANAHAKLDAAVFAAYGWPADLSDEQILEKLLKLNLERAAK
ncbi:MAG: class I SAM-dependent DNA methyltransferase, partial [Verrucomicrobia bacterium]|nr:class I SAM-dependent DNA methyltransferase [Verrucomicrobiota bacterium]